MKTFHNKFPELMKAMESFVESVGNLHSLSQSISQDLQLPKDIFASLHQKLITASIYLAKIDFPLLTQQLFQGIKKYGEKAQQFSIIMVDAGWPPHGDFFPEEIHHIVEYHSKHTQEEVANEIKRMCLEKYHEQEIERLREKWQKSKLLSRRMKILNEAIIAHKRGLYFTSVPALLAQIEGVIAEGYAHYGRMKGSQYIEYIKQTCSRKGMFSFDEAIENFFEIYILVGFDHGATPKSELSRHAILHGGDTNYGSLSNSIKCILIFDYLQSKFGFITIGDGKAYHFPSCPIVVNNRIRFRSTVEIYKDESLIKGKSPCKICNSINNSEGYEEN